MIHFWDLPNKNWVILDEDFKKNLMLKFLNKSKNVDKSLGILEVSKSTFLRMIGVNNYKIRTDVLTKVVKYLNCREFSLEKIEENIIWIGHKNSQGILNPKLPFNFNTKPAIRVLAAIFNEGWVSKGMYYSNSDDSLRNSVKLDALEAFGGNQDSIKEYLKKNDKVLAFPSIMRDLILAYVDLGGFKVDNDPMLPKDILFNSDLMCAWIEQTIADEGDVKFTPHMPKSEKYRKSINWKRSVDLSKDEFIKNKVKKKTSFRKLSKDIQLYLIKKTNNVVDMEFRILNKLRIAFSSYCSGIYFTDRGKIRTRKIFNITRRDNLLRLRKLIKIPHVGKESRFREMFKDYKRYKESSIVKDSVIRICKRKGKITSRDLKYDRGYKNVSCAIRWLRRFEREGLVKCIKNHSYGDSLGRKPGEFILNKGLAYSYGPSSPC